MMLALTVRIEQTILLAPLCLRNLHETKALLVGSR